MTLHHIKTRDFFNSYSGECDDINKFKTIIVTFFQVVIGELLNGYQVELPYLGILKMRKNAPSRSKNWFKTNENKKLGINEPVYREKKPWYSYYWDKNISMKEINSHAKSHFELVITSTNNKLIPKNEDILDIAYE